MIELILAAAAAAVSLVALLYAWTCHRKIKGVERKQDALSLLLKEAERQRDGLRRELNELRSGALGVGRKVKGLEEQLAHTQARQDEMSHNDPDARLYSRAMKMVELGAGVEEIVKECEIPMAEAQLLVTLHKAPKS
ncbi:MULTISPECIES: DUF2802 domain-containing protein [unclassified Ferrimonas]|uniref:DUF2802 domain-containing protein n=1 Tax=unclassified Ferrimonas TaxID=2620587 RepID=UPI00257334AB|nr:DUF2802 domain-containing protein [Ferrimonas sp. YFM]BDY04053.1 DUF2802 domain-containing protein [Ferrimonas sp. YFM]